MQAVVIKLDGPADALARARSVVPVLAEHARSIDETATFPTASLDALREQGLLGLLLPAEYGGVGLDLASLAAVAGELGSGCLSTAMIWSMHCQQLATIVEGATPELRTQLFPRIGRGEIYLASVTTERGSGDLFEVQAPLRAVDADLEVDRDAPIVTGGAVADGFLISMRASPSDPPSRVSLVYAARTELELELSDHWDPLGVRGMHSVSMHLGGRVPETQVIGSPGEFRTLGAATFVPFGIIAWSACWLGAARSAFAQVVGVLRDPKNRSRFDLRSDLFAERLARIRLDLDVVEAHLAQTIAEYEKRSPGRDFDDPRFMVHIYNLKVHSAETLFRVADRLIQLTGMGTGYLRNSPVPLERLFRDLRSASLNNSDDRLLVYSGRLSLFDRDETAS